ncbi:MAG: hypothetical protein ACFFBP_06005 [Promethearchaeota archaeon]
MDLKNDYNKLYHQWLKESRELELTHLSQADFEYYKKSVEYIKNYKLEKEDAIQNEVLKSYKENFKYLLSDFLKSREIKIINAALSLHEIKIENVTEAEKLFFQNLVSSIKGFKKLKELTIYEEFEPIKIEDIIELPGIEKSNKTSKTVQKYETSNEMGTEDDKIIDAIDTTERDKNMYDLTLLRFLKKTPPLVGIDLKNYGPFEKEDIALIPYKNAKILLSEKFAEKINLSH